jgi:putative restriction endonuclease
MLDEYIKRFGRLHTDKNKKRWDQRTTFRAPHKPRVLLSVLDRFAEGAIQSNLVEFDSELVELFNVYWHIVKPPSQRGVIGYPLWHLQNDRFWHLLPRPGYEERIEHGGAITSIKQLNIAASLDENLSEITIKTSRLTKLV